MFHNSHSLKTVLADVDQVLCWLKTVKSKSVTFLQEQKLATQRTLSLGCINASRVSRSCSGVFGTHLLSLFSVLVL